MIIISSRLQTFLRDGQVMLILLRCLQAFLGVMSTSGFTTFSSFL